ncbi:hypothetical protein L0222_11945 [bacterium]|nr:hypothetical protein [bacterium]MCI0604993.1 hypothetical protein [bacterium]
MLWLVLLVLLSLWILKFGLALTGWWIPVLMLGVCLFFLASLFVRHEQR